MPASKDQEGQMRWILFWVFVGLFALTVIGTLMALFFGFGQLQLSERNILFGAFIGEIGTAVVLLFYSLFKLRQQQAGEQAKVRLTLGELADVRRLLGKTATLSASQADGANIQEIECRIHDDNGPYIPLNLPPATHDVLLTVKLGDKTYSGSFVVGAHLVNLIENEA